MGPIALFDKSFLQSLNLDEAVWFDHFFSPIICPLFYVETLADLEKAVRAGRTPEQEVGLIAAKFPEMNGYPCVHHDTLVVHELLGTPVPMNCRVPMAGGRPVVVDGKQGVVYDESPEAEAFGRWQRGAFLEIERDMAREWRGALRELDLKTIALALRETGIDATTCRSLQDAFQLAQLAITSANNPFARLATLFFFLPIPTSAHSAITQRWATAGFPPIASYAPYTAHVLAIELFFHFALAAHQIGADRVTNRVDITYLHYLPFSMVFVSGDDLHRRCAPLFLKQTQEFVWAPELKADLNRINQHFINVPEEVKEAGIMAFANAPPKLPDSLVVRLRERFLRPGYDEEMRARPHRPTVDEKSKKLVDELKKWTSAGRGDRSDLPIREADLQMMSLQRYVSKRRGSWYQVPKNLKDEGE